MSSIAPSKETPIQKPPATVSFTRQKRKQVARACDHCRAFRIKCDSNIPCHNCHTREILCCHSRKPNLTQQAIALSPSDQQIRELERQVVELRGQLRKEQQKTRAREYGQAESHDTHETSISHLPSPPVTTCGGTSTTTELRHWEGIHLRPTRHSQETWFGASSLYHFLYRLGNCLTRSLQQVHSTEYLLQNPLTSKQLLGSAISREDCLDESVFQSANTTNKATSDNFGHQLNAVQEEYFINHFWQSFHTAQFTVVDEAEFKRHHQELWAGSSITRKPSALVDIILALCMQYTVANIPATQQAIENSDGVDASIAGRWYYRRCRTLLTHEMEGPTTTTLQTHLLCAVYLCGGTFHNMVDNCSGAAVRLAYTLGLHLNPASDMPLQEREKRKRLWWAVFVLDSKIGMKLGRPFSIHEKYVMPELPSDSFDVSRFAGSTFAILGQGNTWLSFNLHHTKLYLIVREAYLEFYKEGSILRNTNFPTLGTDTLAPLAKMMMNHARNLDRWAVGVPDCLRIPRADGGRSLSCDRTALKLDQYSPLWLQRQRILLELAYHNLCINLYRPFIQLESDSKQDEAVNSLATLCASHAVTLTNLTHQVLSTTSTLSGWQEVFQWQWNATMTFVGFIYTCREDVISRESNEALDLSTQVFDMFTNACKSAAMASTIVKDLSRKLDYLIIQNQDLVTAQETINSNDLASNRTSNQLTPADLSNFDPNNFNFDMFTDSSNFFEMAMNVEFVGDLNELWPNQGDVLSN